MESPKHSTVKHGTPKTLQASRSQQKQQPHKQRQQQQQQQRLSRIEGLVRTMQQMDSEGAASALLPGGLPRRSTRRVTDTSSNSSNNNSSNSNSSNNYSNSSNNYSNSSNSYSKNSNNNYTSSNTTVKWESMSLQTKRLPAGSGGAERSGGAEQKQQ